MTLNEANRNLGEADCNDPESVAAVLSERARAIVEFAAVAPREILVESLAAGDEFRYRLELAQIETQRELDRMTKLSRGLGAVLDQRTVYRITYFG